MFRGRLTACIVMEMGSSFTLKSLMINNIARVSGKHYSCIFFSQRKVKLQDNRARKYSKLSQKFLRNINNLF